MNRASERSARRHLGMVFPTRAERADSKKKIAAYIRKAKIGRPCADCGGVFHSSAMEFDHVPGRGGKNFSMARPPERVTIRAIQAEMDRCDLVCANCHRKRHADRRGQEVERRRYRAGQIAAIGVVPERCLSRDLAPRLAKA